MADEVYRFSLEGDEIEDVLEDIYEHNSEAWAVGERKGVPVNNTDPTFQKNSKYWASFAADAAEGASIITDPNDDGNLVIDSPTGSESGWAVRYDAAQILSEAQKAQARANISAGGSNENLLDNWDFQVNQRGLSSYTSSSSGFYTVDRWYMYNGSGSNSVSVSSSGITVNSGANGFAQFIDEDKANRLNGKTLTCSVMLSDNSIISATGVYSTTTEVNVGNGFYFGKIGTKYSIFNYTTNGSKSLKAAKVELGTVSTLANDMPSDYGTELLKCMRYFVRFNVPAWSCNFGVGRATSTTNCVVFIPLPVPLRASATVSATGLGEIQLIGNGSAVNVTACAYTGRSEGGINLSFTTSGSLVANNIYTPVRSGSNACYIDLSADL